MPPAGFEPKIGASERQQTTLMQYSDVKTARNEMKNVRIQ